LKVDFAQLGKNCQATRTLTNMFEMMLPFNNLEQTIPKRNKKHRPKYDFLNYSKTIIEHIA